LVFRKEDGKRTVVVDVEADATVNSPGFPSKVSTTFPTVSECALRGQTPNFSVKGNVITNEDPNVCLALDLTQGTVLARDPKLIDGWGVVFESARLLTPEGRMPGILEKLLIGGPRNPLDGLW
jgi:hypothetical protein